MRIVYVPISTSSQTQSSTDFSLESLKIKTYEPNQSYTAREILTDAGFSKLFLVVKDFTATDLITDVSQGNIVEIASTVSNLFNIYKQFDVTITSAPDTITIPLSNPNPSLNRHIFILQKESVQSFDLYPFTFDENDQNNFDYDPQFVSIANSTVKILTDIKLTNEYNSDKDFYELDISQLLQEIQDISLIGFEVV